MSSHAPSPIEQQVRDVVIEICNISNDADRSADLYLDLGVASFMALQILMLLEERFEVRLADEEYVQATSIASLSELVERTLSAAQDPSRA